LPIDLYANPETAVKPPDPEPKLPPFTHTDVYQVVIPESESLVDPGITLNRYDAVRINTAGSIWAGVKLTGVNGPPGWNRLDNDPKFPLPARTHTVCSTS